MNTMIYKKSEAIFDELLKPSWVQKLFEAFNSPVVEEISEKEINNQEEEINE